MELDPQEQIDGRAWFYGAGLAAVLLVFFLMFMDYKLTNSDREMRLADTLRELRSAQFSLASRDNDTRQAREEAHLIKLSAEAQPAKAAEPAVAPAAPPPAPAPAESGAVMTGPPVVSEQAPAAEPPAEPAH